MSEQRRRRRAAVPLLAVAVLGLAGVAVAVATLVLRPEPFPAPSPLGPERIAIQEGVPLAPDTTGTSRRVRDGVACSAGEGTAQHLHAHLAVYVDGVLRPIPAGVGVVAPSITRRGTSAEFARATHCYYWLHVHARDGIIHIETPTKNPSTLGQFFAVWGQPLSASRVAGAKGRVTVLVDGRVVRGDPADVVLRRRESIQIDVGARVPFQPVDWSRSHL
ncbi:hypothetical protein [Amnibacterium kyonggiense]|uniref:hypothetical protein n=1 Tax=Amnibacterium kyonggiense TaxID=595671 RepID=UPI00105FE791|nr:hypothetical protein [Amnibacterium kyonggiense]